MFVSLTPDEDKVKEWEETREKCKKEYPDTDWDKFKPITEKELTSDDGKTKYPGFYTQEQLYLGYIPGLDSLDYIRNLENSQYATYREYNHEASLMLRYNVGENRVNFGVSF